MHEWSGGILKMIKRRRGQFENLFIISREMDNYYNIKNFFKKD